MEDVAIDSKMVPRSLSLLLIILNNLYTGARRLGGVKTGGGEDVSKKSESILFCPAKREMDSRKKTVSGIFVIRMKLSPIICYSRSVAPCFY
jgi:hypothetical protein